MNKSLPRSYRFDLNTVNILKKSLKRVNKISPKKISETRLLKAMILLSSETPNEILTKALKEVW